MSECIHRSATARGLLAASLAALLSLASASAEVRLRFWLAPIDVTWSGGASALTPIHTPATVATGALADAPPVSAAAYGSDTTVLGLWARFDQPAPLDRVVIGLNLKVSGPAGATAPVWYQYRQPATGLATAQRWDNGSDFDGPEAVLVGGFGGVTRGFRNRDTADDRLDAFSPAGALADGTQLGQAAMLLAAVPTQAQGFYSLELGALGVRAPGEPDVKVAFGEDPLWYPAGEIAPSLRREGIGAAAYVGGPPPKGFEPPRFTSQPASRLTCTGATVTLSATAEASCPVRYQWFKDGVALLGQRGPTLTLDDVTPADAGVYVNGATGCDGASSAPAIVRFAQRGDTNGDGIVGFDDIECFVFAQIQQFKGWSTCTVIPADEAAFFCANDINGDGIVGFDDVEPFVLCVLIGCP